VPLSLSTLRERHVVRGRPLPETLEAALRADPRPGARALLAAIEQRRRRNRAEGQRLRNILRYETSLWDEGLTHVAGVDEAGMSPLAGPVAAAAVIFTRGARIRGVDDSKKLDPRERARLAPIIKEQCLSWAVAFVEPEEIDRINIYWAGLLAMQRAVEALSPRAQHLLIDGRRLRAVALPQQRIVKGDEKSLSIAAASILAKTARDARMCEMDALYPGYGFAQHKGYPVREHVRALESLGACPIHRRSFAPVRIALGLPLLAGDVSPEHPAEPAGAPPR
jgi:ribonuclease HII